MRSRYVAAFWLPAALLCACPAAAQPADATANAAVQYWQAFALLPALDKDQEKLLMEWNRVPLDAKALQLIEASRAGLMYLHRGAKLRRCDWGLDYNDGISMMIPHIAKARALARVAALRARHAFEQGDRKAGREDATAVMTLARHVGSDPILISILVRYAIEEIVLELVTPYLPELKVTHAQVVALYEALPPAATIAQAVLPEKRFMAEYVVKQLRAAEQTKKGSWRDLWKRFLDGTQAPDAVQRVETLEQAVKMTEDLYPMYDELARIVALPREEFEAQYPKFVAKAQTISPFAGVLLPKLDKCLATERRTQARMAMLLAAAAVVQDGPGKLKDIKAPFGAGPFEYRALDKGFELKSQLLYDGQPVTLTVGPRKKG